jgi:hypothetical protein
MRSWLGGGKLHRAGKNRALRRETRNQQQLHPRRSGDANREGGQSGGKLRPELLRVDIDALVKDRFTSTRENRRIPVCILKIKRQVWEMLLRRRMPKV